MKEVLVTMEIPDKAFEKLDKYGYDWKRNSEEKARDVYLCLCYCEEQEENNFEKYPGEKNEIRD